MYDVIEHALRTGGIPADCRDPLIDRGDGVLVLVRPVDPAPTTLLLNPVIPVLTGLLAEHNTRHPDLELRLRAVVHAGEVHHDQRGCFGESLDLAFRLLDAPEVKTALRRAAAPLVLVTSDYVYRSIIRHGYDGIDARGFAPLAVDVAGEAHRGWAGGDTIAPWPSTATTGVGKGSQTEVDAEPDRHHAVIGDVDDQRSAIFLHLNRGRRRGRV
ncbi:hypothetical protein AB0A74_00775 [Saccharothrix sp. NPDC042600]|uniref:hypothetical protein n=1 Tax=Saccharothrix TaxID=2071 RepID=UPI0033C5A3FC